LTRRLDISRRDFCCVFNYSQGEYKLVGIWIHQPLYTRSQFWVLTQIYDRLSDKFIIVDIVDGSGRCERVIDARDAPATDRVRPQMILDAFPFQRFLSNSHRTSRFNALTKLAHNG
jgi:hypothetical protein